MSSHGEFMDEDIEEKSIMSTFRGPQNLAESPKRVNALEVKVA